MKILIATSTFPVSDCDEVPGFVKDQIVHMKEQDPTLSIIVHAPHSYYSRTSQHQLGHKSYKEVRFHYFWPFQLELLAGKGIMPALTANRLLFGLIPFFFLFQLLSLWRLARKEKPDLLYAHWFTPQAITTALVSALTRIPFAFTTHASDVAVLRRAPFSDHLVQLICKRARVYTAVSQRTALKLKQFFTDADSSHELGRKLRIIPMGVDISERQNADADLAERACAKYGLDSRPVLLFLGRLVEKKGVAYLIEAMSMVPESTRNRFQLIVAGDGQSRNNLEQRVTDLGLSNVTFVGYVTGQDKAAIMASAKFMCLPSIVDQRGDSEGLPVVLMECLAAGKVMLASDASGAEELLQHGKNGILFTQQSSVDLAEKLEWAMSLTDGEVKSIGEAGRSLASHFDWKTISRRYFQLLKDAASAV